MPARPAGAVAGADVLSDVLRAVRLNGAVYFDFELSDPWVAEAPASREIAAAVMPGAERVIEYHLIARGACWGSLPGQEPICLGEGDLIVFPQGDAHVLSSAPGMRASPDPAMYARPATPLPIYSSLGRGDAPRGRIVCCFLGCDERPYNPLLASLPRVMHLAARDRGASADWLTSLFTAALAESTVARPGRENILQRLSELMFVEMIRHHLERLPATENGWLAGLRDPMVGAALEALHGDPRAAWTIERLARRVGASRSIFAERFTAMVGEPPMRYLALWRMQLAARLLADGQPVAAAAEAVGYESEAAFNRAFKKRVGLSPGAWRTATLHAGVTRSA